MKNRLPRQTGVLVIRWAVVPVLLLGSGLLVASNVVLQTRMARSWFEKKLERRSGLDWHIRYLSWTPWSGLQVGGVTASFEGEAMREAAPLFAIEEMDAEVYWSELWKGRLAPRELRVSHVRVAVPFELAGMLAAPDQTQPEPDESGDSDVAGAAGQDASKSSESRRKEPRNGEPRRRRPSASKAGAETPAEQRQEPENRESVDPVHRQAELPITLVIDDCEVGLYSLAGGGEPAVAVRGVRARLPMGGEDSDGWFALDEAIVAGELVAGQFRLPVQWRRPFLVVPAQNFEVAGLGVEAAATLRTRGLPVCNVQLRLPPGPLEQTPVPGWSELSVSAAKVEMQSRFRGNLADVGSWRGDSILEVSGLKIGAEGRDEVISFDAGRVTAVLQGAVAQVADARVVSERLSLLGNGMMLPDGRVAAILRIVADHEYAEALTRVASGSLISGGWTRSWLEPLQTPDRFYRDIDVRGSMRNAAADVGRDRAPMRVQEAWKRMVAFLKREAAEAERGVAPSPPREKILIPESP